MSKINLLFWACIAGMSVALFFLPPSPLLGPITLKECLFAASAPLVVFMLEMVVVGWKQCALRQILFNRDHSHRTDLTFFLFHITGVMPALVIIFSLGCSYLLGQLGQNVIRTATGLNLRIDTGNGFFNFTIYYLLYSFLEYWSHRLFHTEPFWQLHRLHHSATSLNPLVMHRAHPANLFLDSLLRTTLPVALVATPGFALFAFFIATSFYQLLVHSNIPWDWGWFGRWVLISPHAHKIHHSIKPEHYGKNLSVLVLWDRLFGTWYEGDAPPDQLGLPENYHSRTLAHNCFQDMGLFFTGLYRKLAYAASDKKVELPEALTASSATRSPL